MLVPDGWSTIEGLTCGFGGRDEDVSSRTGSAQVVAVKQVHGRELVDAGGLSAAGAIAAVAAATHEADGIVVSHGGVVAAIKTADCVPLLMIARDPSDARGRPCWAAAVHAGWRGTVAGIATAAVERAREAGVAPATLEVALGPSIGPCCYQVGEEVAARFEDLGLPVLREGGTDGVRLDLRAVNAAILAAAGVDPARIQCCGPCTHCRADRYFSYRADPSNAGRQLSWIGWRSLRRAGEP